MKLVGCIAAFIAAASTARAGTTPTRLRVAVVPSAAVDLDIARVDALSQDLAEALMVDLDVDAAGGIDVRRKLPSEGLPGDCIARAECVADVATRLGVDQLLFVAMVDVGNTGAIQIDSMWVDPAHDKRASRPAIALASIDNAKARFIANARRLLPDAPLVAKQTFAPLPGKMVAGEGRHITTPVLVSSAGFVAGLGVGIGFGLAARSRFYACSAAPCTESQLQDVRTLALVADIGHATWVVSAGLATYFYMTSSREPRFVVSPTEGGATATVYGRF